MPAATRRQRNIPDIWPGFVDALASLLIIIIFLLMVFTLAQYFLSEALSGRNAALERLNRTVAELQEMLALERQAGEELRANIAQLSDDLQASITARDQLSSQLAELLPERDALKRALADRSSALAAMTDRATDAEERARSLERDLADAFTTIDANKETIEARLAEIASLMRDLEALRTVRGELETRVANLASTLQLTKDELVEMTARYKAGQEENARLAGERNAAHQELTALRDRTKSLAARLSTQEERTALAQEEIEKREIRLKEALARSGDLEAKLTEEQQISAAAQQQVQILNQQIAALRLQLARIEKALEISEEESKSQKVQIADLGRRLNLALASKVEELSRYRSEFFGRLREVVGDRKDIRRVGDRFVFQSEVLFASGSATLSLEGMAKIAQLSETLLEIAKSMPKDLDWIVRVDGHTDRVPISTYLFPSNWELSSQRAISVVKYMTELGVPPDRLIAAGFGQFHPIDDRDTEEAYRRNRRIEFKLTQR